MGKEYEFYEEIYEAVVQNVELDKIMIINKLCNDDELYSNISDIIESRIKDIITGRFEEDEEYELE